MGDHLIASVTSIATAIIGVAFLAVLVSRNANTTGVITSSGNAFSQGLSAAEAPVTGGNSSFSGFQTGGLMIQS